MSSTATRRVLAGVAALCAAPLVLLVFDLRVLVSETKVNPGDAFVTADYGDVGKAAQSSLVCRYFTGRSIVTRVVWYSPNNILGRDQCEFVVRD